MALVIFDETKFPHYFLLKHKHRDSLLMAKHDGLLLGEKKYQKWKKYQKKIYFTLFFQLASFFEKSLPKLLERVLVLLTTTLRL